MSTKEIWRPIEGYEGRYEVSNLGNVKSLNYRGLGYSQILKQGYNKSGHKWVYLTKDKHNKKFYIHRLVAMAFIPIPERLKDIPIEELQVDHIDANPENNNLENLHWVTQEENMNNVYTRYHIRIAQSKLWKDPEYRKSQGKALSKALKGRKFTEAQRKAISEGRKGMKFSEEHRRHIGESKKGKFVGGKSVCALKVIQYSKDYEFIKVWDSIADAGRELNIERRNISSCCIGKRHTAGGYRWKYKQLEDIRLGMDNKKGVA